MVLHFRTRGGPTQGWGNIHRLATFADYCRPRGHQDLRFFAEGPPEVHDYLRGRGFETVELPDGIGLDDERAILERFPRSRATIVEMLDCHPRRQHLLRERTDRLAIIDDLLDHRFDADLVICGQSLPHYGNIAISHPKTRFLTGYDYFIFDPAYRRYAGRSRPHRPKVESVLVAFGGGRYDAAYLKTALALAALDPRPTISVVLGYAPREDLGRELADLLPGAAILGGVSDMPDRLAAADLAIVSGGYLKLEAAATATPMVMIATQWHQMPLAEEFTRHTGAPYAGYMGFVTPATIGEALAALAPVAARAALAERMRAVVDGQGINRVYDAIFGASEQSEP